MAIDCRAFVKHLETALVIPGGQIQVFKSLVASKSIYGTSVISISDSSIQDIKYLHKEFIWSNRKPKIKHTALIGDYAEGGLKDVDIESKLIWIKISWV